MSETPRGRPRAVILTYGVYARGLAFQDHPDILEGSTNKDQNWETSDPERWVPHGYAVVRVDSRGAGWSPGPGLG